MRVISSDSSLAILKPTVKRDQTASVFTTARVVRLRCRRISYAYSLDNLKIALSRLERFVKNLREERKL